MKLAYPSGGLFAALRTDKGGWILLSLLAVLAVVVPLLHLAVPPGSAFHMSSYGVTLIGKYLTYGLLALVVFVWGANWPTMKMGLHHITPLWFAAARFWMGSLCLFALLAVQGRLNSHGPTLCRGQDGLKGAWGAGGVPVRAAGAGC